MRLYAMVQPGRGAMVQPGRGAMIDQWHGGMVQFCCSAMCLKFRGEKARAETTHLYSHVLSQRDPCAIRQLSFLELRWSLSF